MRLTDIDELRDEILARIEYLHDPEDIKGHVQEMFDTAVIIAEQKKGHWVTNEVGVVRCSECHANMRLRNNKRPNFCDVCGADMRGIR